MTLRTAASAVLAFAVLTGGQPAATAEQNKPAAAANVTVTVKYTGKGAVDETHRLWVWLFTTAEIGPGSIPIAEQSVGKNGQSITFTSVAGSPVYVAVAYDEKGGFSGNAPPPLGSPVTLYGAKEPQDKPAPVTPAAKTAIAVTLTDAQRMQ